ncbi:MAG: PBP1A family penicillin-binding protein [Treponema sp.]|uniref:penicillin-binding protein 1A n=1 Tax=Treponema sp. TaxID=166 RepID=UPI00298E4918|nr:PBP1A family penicillin-binding protein [Treponema sp.]MBR5933625.1 PBP1A family penicillin-binding protein [Treponema sp.]
MKNKKSINVFISLNIFFAVTLGTLLGLGIAESFNTANIEQFLDLSQALPTKILDINSELITEFTSDEKREVISIYELPKHMVDALITREDRIFYEHHGFNTLAIIRAMIGQVTHLSLGGGSTLTQQIAGTLYCNRKEMSLKRKLRELWWAIQMERRYSKKEILELYLNQIPFGGGTGGVNAASTYYFGHSAREITPAESAILVVQLSNPTKYNPFEHPNAAKDRQKYVLDSMVKEGYITQKESDESFDDYWLNFDYTRINTSAYYNRDDKAPWFSEYVRRELADMIYGDDDIYKSGFTVNTTGNLAHLRQAQLIMERQIENANKQYQVESAYKQRYAVGTYLPMAEMAILLFDLKDLKMSGQRANSKTISNFTENITPMIDIFSVLCGIENLKVGIINRSTTMAQNKAKASTIEGALINIENDTGYITALIGGSKFDQSNQLIRATQAKVQPGSSIKPLYYSAGLDTKKITAATMFDDAPYKFTSPDGTPYLPNNYGGAWHGPTLMWKALALSLNIPALKLLEQTGFDASIKRMVDLLGIPEKELPSRAFIPGFPLGLGTCSVRPIEMARAYAIFANGGKAIQPTAIRTVEDRKGNIIINNDQKVREAILKPKQVISPENAFVMTKIMESSVTIGTLRYGAAMRSIDPSLTGSKFTFIDKQTGKTFNMPVSGKTGTTQNWGDAWAIGFTPYYTCAVWFGFDTPGKSMGMGMTGATLAGPPWGDFMMFANKDLPFKEFPMPEGKVHKATVCAETGEWPSENCKNVVTLWFMDGTNPTEHCHIHSEGSSGDIFVIRAQDAEIFSGQKIEIDDNGELELNLDFLDDSKPSKSKKQSGDDDSNQFMD